MAAAAGSWDDLSPIKKHALMNLRENPLESLAAKPKRHHQAATRSPGARSSRWPIAAAMLLLAPTCSAFSQTSGNGPDPVNHATATDAGPQDGGGQPRADLAIGDVTVTQVEQRLRLTWPVSASERQEIRLPRLAATVRSCHWSEGGGPEIAVVPEPTEWRLQWAGPAPGNAAIDLHLESEPLRLAQVPRIQPSADGSVWLPAHRAATHGRNLRFEPQPFKNTIGYWTLADDHALWSFVVDQPGEYRIAVLQGCGAGQGGSEAKIEILRDDAVVAVEEFRVEETGHFQNFKWRSLGLVRLENPGQYQLKLSALRIARAAVGDFRAIHLVRQAQGR
jgi:hypothetical protein